MLLLYTTATANTPKLSTEKKWIETERTQKDSRLNGGYRSVYEAHLDLFVYGVKRHAVMTEDISCTSPQKGKGGKCRWKRWMVRGKKSKIIHFYRNEYSQIGLELSFSSLFSHQFCWHSCMHTCHLDMCAARARAHIINEQSRQLMMMMMTVRQTFECQITIENNKNYGIIRAMKIIAKIAKFVFHLQYTTGACSVYMAISTPFRHFECDTRYYANTLDSLMPQIA